MTPRTTPPASQQRSPGESSLPFFALALALASDFFLAFSAMMTYEEGLGAKLAMGIQFLSGFLAAMVIAFAYNFYVSLLTIALMPLVAASLSWLVKLNNEQVRLLLFSPLLRFG